MRRLLALLDREPALCAAYARIRVTPRLDPVAAVPPTGAGLTPYLAIKRALAALVPGSTAVVIGGLGGAALPGRSTAAR